MAEQLILDKQKSKWPLKILHAGQIRTGSASLAVALDKLGYGPVHHFVTNEFDPKGIQRSDFAWSWFHANLPKIDNGQDVDWDEFFKKTEVYSALDTPLNVYWEDVFKKYPNVKVILTVRDSFDIWYKSVTRFYEIIFIEMPIWYKMCLIFNNIHNPLFGIPIEGKEISVLMRHNVKNYGGWDKLITDKAGTEKKYVERTEYIKSVVPKEQLLIFNVKQGWEPLCDFLDVPKEDIPTTDFPRINNQKELSKTCTDYHYRELNKFLLYRAIPCLVIGITAYIGIKHFKNNDKIQRVLFK